MTEQQAVAPVRYSLVRFGVAVARMAIAVVLWASAPTQVATAHMGGSAHNSNATNIAVQITT